jgi:hypothetical protein
MNERKARELLEELCARYDVLSCLPGPSRFRAPLAWYVARDGGGGDPVAWAWNVCGSVAVLWAVASRFGLSFLAVRPRCSESCERDDCAGCVALLRGGRGPTLAHVARVLERL